MQYAEVLECVVSPVSRLPRQVSHKPMKILIDARKIDHGGIGMYTRNLIAGLASIEGLTVTAIVHPKKADIISSLGDIRIIEDAAPLYSIDELLFLSKRIPFKEFDIFHSPHYMLPYRIPIPTVVTIHDTIHITHPQKFYYPLIAKMFIRSAMKRATKVLTVSETSRRDLERVAPKWKRKLSVVSNAVDPYFMLEALSADPEVELPSRQNYFVATFSNIKPHKGFFELIEAFQLVKKFGTTLSDGDPLKALIHDVHLRLVGIGTKKLPENFTLPEGLLVFGEVNTKELHDLYARSLALIVASHVEGFCLPAIEAQASATPVIARPVPAVLELMTTNDHVCKDFTIQGLVEGIIEFMRKKIQQPENFDGVPLEHMKRFCRAEVSQAVLGIYQQAVNAR